MHEVIWQTIFTAAQPGKTELVPTPDYSLYFWMAVGTAAFLAVLLYWMRRKTPEETVSLKELDHVYKKETLADVEDELKAMEKDKPALAARLRKFLETHPPTQAIIDKIRRMKDGGA